MSCYVDDMYKYTVGRFHRMKMSHLIADSELELRNMVKRIGLNPYYIQEPGTMYEHFDVSISMRTKCIYHGAIEVSMIELVKIIHSRTEYCIWVPPPLDIGMSAEDIEQMNQDCHEMYNGNKLI